MLTFLLLESRILNFKTSCFGTLALIQDSHINMPFQSWELRPHSTNSALFTIIAAIVEVELEIKVSGGVQVVLWAHRNTHILTPGLSSTKISNE